MEIKRRTPDLETVFNQNWKANNMNQNGIKQSIDNNKNHFNQMYGIKSKEDHKKEILEANSVNGQVQKLEQSMKAASSFMNKNKF